MAAVVSQNYRGESFGLELLKVPDAKDALQELGRSHLSGQVVAITGSVGKTTTKFFAKQLLPQAYSSPRSYNSQLTLPLCVLDAEEDLLLLEMGMSEPGQIAKLVAIAPPEIAILTNVSLQHMDLFPGGIEEIAKEKSMIFSHPQTKVAIVPKELAHLAPIETRTVSLVDSEADYLLRRQGEKVEILRDGTKVGEGELRLPLPVYDLNYLLAFALACEWGASPCVIQVEVPPMRFERLEREGIVYINDAYNANPSSFRAALVALGKEEGRKIAVLGDMNALGVFSDHEHAKIMDQAEGLCDHVLALGRNWKTKHFSSKRDLQIALDALLKPGDVVLLKGSRMHRLEELLQKE